VHGDQYAPAHSRVKLLCILTDDEPGAPLAERKRLGAEPRGWALEQAPDHDTNRQDDETEQSKFD